MADFRHPNRALIWRSLPADQLIFQMDFNHFTHQAIRRAGARRQSVAESPDKVRQTQAPAPALRPARVCDEHG